jgi:hypothetical protein
MSYLRNLRTPQRTSAIASELRNSHLLFPTAMVATAVHAQVPASAASSLMVPLHKASCVLVRGVQDGGPPRLSPDELRHVVNLYQVATRSIEAIEDSLLELSKAELADMLIQMETLVNVSQTIKMLADAALKAPTTEPDTRALQFGRQLGSVFISFHERLTETADLVRHLAQAPAIDEDSPEFGEFLVRIGTKALAA